MKMFLEISIGPKGDLQEKFQWMQLLAKNDRFVELCFACSLCIWFVYVLIFGTE